MWEASIKLSNPSNTDSCTLTLPQAIWSTQDLGKLCVSSGQWWQNLEGTETLRVVLDDGTGNFVVVLHGVTYVPGANGPGKVHCGGSFSPGEGYHWTVVSVST
jgi:hypothetical protein